MIRTNAMGKKRRPQIMTQFICTIQTVNAEYMDQVAMKELNVWFLFIFYTIIFFTAESKSFGKFLKENLNSLYRE